MSNLKDELWAVKYYPDEIQIETAKCLQPWNCTCAKSTEEVKCGYTTFETRALVIKYYQDKIDYISRQSDKDFLHDMGYYD